MKDRINQIIRAKNLTAAEFALRLGIQPSSVSHLLAGRNNPSLDFVKKLKETFPEYNLDWIVFGKGPVTISEPMKETASDETRFPSEPPSVHKTLPENDLQNTLFDSENLGAALPGESIGLSEPKQVKYLVWVYSDNTFEVMCPASK